MRKNKFIYYGMLVVAASALIWLGAWLTQHIKYILPYTGAVGLLLIIIGVVMELRKREASRLPPAPEAETEARS